MTPDQINQFRQKMLQRGIPPSHVEQFIETKLEQQEASATIQPEEKKSFGGFVGNILKSGGNLIKDTASAVVNAFNPNMEKNTVANLGRIGLGAVEKAIPGEQGAEQDFDAVVDYYKQRYGEDLVNTLYEDPVGVLADLSTLASGVNAGLRTAGRTGAAAKASKVASVTDPLRLQPSKLVPRGKAAQSARELYQSALKPSGTPDEVNRVVSAGLNEKVPVSFKGLNDVANTIDELNGEIAAIIKLNAQYGDEIPSAEVLSYLDKIEEFAQNTATPTKYLKQIDEIRKDFTTHGDAIPVDKAQTIKQNTYRILKDSYGEFKAIENQAQKSIALGIKEQLLAKYPELKKLNAKDSALIQLQDELEKFVKKEGNKQLFGTLPAVTGAVGGIKGMALGFLPKLLNDPGIKSKIAILLQKIADRQLKGPGAVRKSLTPATRLTQPSREQNQ